MKRTYCIVTLLTLTLCSPCMAQHTMTKKADNKIEHNRLKYVGIGILGSLKHPGAELNYSIPHRFFKKEKSRKGKIKTIYKTRRWDVFARYYYHRNFHHHVMLTAGRTWQRSLQKGKFFISQADVGISRTINARPTFRVENGFVKQVRFVGDFYMSANYRFGIGKHFKRKENTYRYYLYFGVLNFAPYNNFFYPRMVMGLNINKFLKK